MATGTVKWFNATKGYGFIQPDGGGKDVFVHISAVEKAGFTGLAEGAKISYEIVSDRGKEFAGICGSVKTPIEQARRFTPAGNETIPQVAVMSIAALPASSPWRGQARRCYRHYGVGPSHLSSERACRLKPAGLSFFAAARAPPEGTPAVLYARQLVSDAHAGSAILGPDYDIASSHFLLHRFTASIHR